ncbi:MULTISPECIES: DUF6082 family protein [Streptomyces]|uniref:DUF6082 family protein n=1 Tax=Streptomyces spinosisporus TaxID=2927582 RepID=A0ABS9XB95_9ACTN|nr:MULTISPECIES: DUF6082 family protein [Streptomyces]EPD65673.1 hypothetical protein HMPREF1211_02228 [Streptomyces sp. HGB0020]MCI3238137.1 DUF6082 family protein [Streptomyces spinosisporus]WUB35439.1 DUF6082 family protein [Streptomyces sp. NBC_00588]
MATQGFAMWKFGSAAWSRISSATHAITQRGLRYRKRAALAEQHRLHFDLLCKAMVDPALAAVLDTYESDVPADRQRQYLFANALYVNALYFHRIGALSLAELYGHLRVMCRNQIFREYWAATRHHRDSLPASSEEAALGEMMDALVADMNTALDVEDDNEEWWVVGQAPDE